MARTENGCFAKEKKVDEVRIRKDGGLSVRRGIHVGHSADITPSLFSNLTSQDKFTSVRLKQR